MTMNDAIHNPNPSRCLRIGVFYDGGFFHHISNYYRYSHPRRQRISVPGLHEFIRVHAAECEGVEASCAHIVESHFFRGRFSAQQTLARDKLYTERLFDDVLMNENVTTHYRSIQGNSETGVDVWLSLEALDIAMRGRIDLAVLVAGDSDFVPLVMKLNSLGVRVMLLGWNFDYTDDAGSYHQTTTSIRLMGEVTYPVAMHEIMDGTESSRDPIVRGLFVEPSPTVGPHEGLGAPSPAAGAAVPAVPPPPFGTPLKGVVCTLKEGFGFIRCPEYPNNVFFHFSAVVGREFEDLNEGDAVSFTVEQRDKGPVAKDVTVEERSENN